jgi:ABC-type glycerol-3-phosphate transport system substrate-binding protein
MQNLKRRFAALVAGCTSLLATVALAQDPGTSGGSSTSQTTTTTVTSWYSEPWVWLVAGGIAVFLIVVIALTNRGGTSRSA